MLLYGSSDKVLNLNSLRGHPYFNQIVTSRLQHDDERNLAKALTDLSVGRQQ